MCAARARLPDNAGHVVVRKALVAADDRTPELLCGSEDEAIGGVGVVVGQFNRPACDGAVYGGYLDRWVVVCGGDERCRSSNGLTVRNGSIMLPI